MDTVGENSDWLSNQQKLITNTFGAKQALTLDIRISVSGINNATVDERYIDRLIRNACEKFVGKIGLAQLNPEVQQIDQFTSSTVVRLTQVSESEFLKFWTALTFCTKPETQVRL